MSDSQLVGLAKDFFQNSLDSSPTSAIMRGHKKYFDQIEELTEEQFQKEKDIVDTFIQRLNAIEQDNLILFEKSLTTFTASCPVKLSKTRSVSIGLISFSN